MAIQQNQLSRSNSPAMTSDPLAVRLPTRARAVTRTDAVVDRLEIRVRMVNDIV